MIDQHASLAEKFLKKGFWLYLFSFIIAPIGYIIKIILSGDLSVSEIGILYGIISLVTMISAYNDLGLTESMKYYLPKLTSNKNYSKVKSLIIFSLFFQVLSSIIISGFLYFGANAIAEIYFKNDSAFQVLQVFSIFFIGYNVFQTFSQFFLAVQDTLYHQLSEFIRLTFVLGSVVYIFLSGDSSLVQYSYSWVIGLYIGIILSLVLFYRKYYSKYLINVKLSRDISFYKEVFGYATMVVISTSAATILSQIDMQMIIYFLGSTDAGYYTNYLSIISIPFMILGPIFGFLFPVISELFSKQEFQKITDLKKYINHLFILLGIIVSIFFFTFSKEITYILFGEKFLFSGIILQYSVLFLTFNFLYQINFALLAGMGKVKQRMKIIFGAIGINVILNILFISIFGSPGAALASGIGWIFIYIISEFYLRNGFKTKFLYKNILMNLGVFSILGFLIYKFFIENFIELGGIQTLTYTFLCFVLWFIIFGLLNYNFFIKIIREIKKIKYDK